ncbi:hypothetical protein Slin15195_G012880 [Septoria linicola]|uniref:Uncharacterized protein n=1 Tax=Septoria linicola TaxID=215465 RepID=A0A9Q9EFJ2_9PEZI|nr:hypothetical protein Slin14017_G012910 [Septoria linicola]USW47969.1 hypothetical protein Slin15195_G012880 [Septoria linicola]
MLTQRPSLCEPATLCNGYTAKLGPAVNARNYQDSSQRLPLVTSQQKALPRVPLATEASLPSAPLKHRPTSLNLAKASSNGLSTLPSPLLKRVLRSAHVADDQVTKIQIPAPDRRGQLPPTPTTPLASLVMGNSHSSVSGSPIPDDRSQRSVVHVRRHSKPMIRKSSSNLFKRVDSRSPLPRDVTASVMSSLQRDGTKKDDSGLEDSGVVSLPTDPFLKRPDKYDHRYPGCSPSNRAVNSTSTVTMTESRANMPLSASTTVQNFNSSSIELNDSSAEFPRIEEPVPEDDLLESLSPVIPAPSPLPEDSPHKYGLRDSADTPPVSRESPKMQVPKARRKSSGVEIFKEAQNLQQAQSFLNGLSTSRRRAESAAAVQTDTTDSSWCDIAAQEPRSGSSHPPSRPSTALQDGEGRRKGHNFKSSGFAYSRPLTLAQLKCYRGHARLLLNRNKFAPVECAVCHMDDDGECFSCSWCALRMCRHCRLAFAEKGPVALKERIKVAEMGGRADSAHTSSSESLQELVKITSNFTA